MEMHGQQTIKHKKYIFSYLQHVSAGLAINRYIFTTYMGNEMWYETNTNCSTLNYDMKKPDSLEMSM
jgi:hypothetical protein